MAPTVFSQHGRTQKNHTLAEMRRALDRHWPAPVCTDMVAFHLEPWLEHAEPSTELCRRLETVPQLPGYPICRLGRRPHVCTMYTAAEYSHYEKVSHVTPLRRGRHGEGINLKLSGVSNLLQRLYHIPVIIAMRPAPDGGTNGPAAQLPDSLTEAVATLLQLATPPEVEAR